MQESSYIYRLINCSFEAAEIILSYYRGDIEVITKLDDSPVTLADKEADKVICREVRANSDLPIVSEEGDDKVAITNDYWLIDPLDGTKEFIKKGRYFTTNIALIRGNMPVLGVIYTPVTRELFFTFLGASFYKKFTEQQLLPCFKTASEFALFVKSDCERLQVSSASGEDKLKIVASKSHLSQETQDYINSLSKNGKENDFVSVASSLKFCLVANGKADIYPRFSPTMQWDTAAGHAILLQAGGRVMEVTGQDYLYRITTPYKSDMLNRSFIADNGLAAG